MRGKSCGYKDGSALSKFTTVQKFNVGQARDAHGRWTSSNGHAEVTVDDQGIYTVRRKTGMTSQTNNGLRARVSAEDFDALVEGVPHQLRPYKMYDQLVGEYGEGNLSPQQHAALDTLLNTMHRENKKTLAATPKAAPRTWTGTVTDARSGKQVRVDSTGWREGDQLTPEQMRRIAGHGIQATHPNQAF